MKIFQKKSEFIAWRESRKTQHSLVPTMGNLHSGHLSLVKEALEHNETCVVSIFVNPLQFGEGEDFEKYPKTLEADIEKLQSLEGNGKSIVVFAPASSDDVLPHNNLTHIDVRVSKSILCDQFRPGHFIGVTTVVYHLFKLIRPSAAFFGQKDYQQFLLISKMTRDLDLGVKVQMCPIVRDESGLALSSRNQYLSKSDKQEALRLSEVLNNSTKIIQTEGPDKANQFLERAMSEDSRFQYLEVLDASSLESPTKNSRKLVVAGAFIIGDTRLIDNFLVSL